MQHRRGILKWRHPRLAALGLLAAMLVVAAVVLMAIDVPAPSRAIEKELDAKAFLEPRKS